MDSRSRSNRDVLFVGRTDYRLTIHTPPGESLNPAGDLSSMAEKKKQSSAQEIAYSTYTPNSFDKPLAELWATMGRSELYEDDGSKVKRMRVELRHDGAAIGVEQGTGARWSALLGSPG
jgi:serine/threonine-protein kinase/endoribonuclease IRE1